MDYGFEHQGKVYTPDGSAVDPAENEARNAAIEQAELEAWQRKPDRFTGYVNLGSNGDFSDGRFTTWRGAELGRVYVISKWTMYNRLGEPYKMTAIHVVGNNGAVYVGRYGSDWSQVCRVRRSA